MSAGFVTVYQVVIGQVLDTTAMYIVVNLKLVVVAATCAPGLASVTTALQ